MIRFLDNLILLNSYGNDDRDNGVERKGKLYEIEVTNINIEILKEKCKDLEKRVSTWEDNFHVPVEKLADDIRNNIVIPLLRMAQKPEGLEIKRDDKLLNIGNLFEHVDEK